jgi:hypothetical protein
LYGINTVIDVIFNGALLWNSEAMLGLE